MKNLNVFSGIESRRKIILTISLILGLAACLLPPWKVYWIGNFDAPMLMELGYGFLFTCPRAHEIFKCFIDWDILITELLAIGFLSGIGIVLTKAKVKF